MFGKFRQNKAVFIGAVTVGVVLMLATAVAAWPYRVKRGDTLYQIARQSGVSVTELVQANHISNPNLILEGQIINIPDGSYGNPEPYYPPNEEIVFQGNTFYDNTFINDSFHPSFYDAYPSSWSGSVNDYAYHDGGYGYHESYDGYHGIYDGYPSQYTVGKYIVVSGDTLFSIALHFGTTADAIMRANHLPNPNNIQPGQSLIIPRYPMSSLPPVYPTQAPPPPVPPIAGRGPFELGGESTSLEHVGVFYQANMTWIKVEVPWTSGNSPKEWAGMINDAHNSGLKILMTVVGAQAYPGRIDYPSYVNFVRELAGLGPDAIEVWDNMNTSAKWPAGQISPYNYVHDLLQPAYTAIKLSDPDVMVIAGGLTPTSYDDGVNAWTDARYLDGLRWAGALSSIDCWGVHYISGATSPYVTVGNPLGIESSWYFRPLLDLYYTMAGKDRPLCITSLGYLSGDGFDGLPANSSWASQTSVGEQAQWLGDAVKISRESGRVRLAIVYNIDSTVYDLNGEPFAGYAILRPDGGCPACGLLEAVLNDR